MNYWIWLKGKWEWLVTGLALVGGYFLVLFLLPKSKDVLSDDKEKDEAEDKADTKDKEAAEERDQQKKKLEEERNKDLAVLVDKQTQKAKELESDPEATNEWLKEVGKDVLK